VTTPQEDAARLFEIIDVDGNGVISREEARAGFQYLIASYDRAGKSEILAAKPGGSLETTTKRKSKRRPTADDANRAFEALFEKSTKASDGVSKEEFKKLIVKSSDNPDTDPFVAFY
jgi:Ca2+-binding EF-hand superfamily protein